MDNAIDNKSEQSIKQLFGKMEQSVREKNLSLWISLFHMEDSLVIEAQENWFNGFVIKGNPVGVQFELMSMKPKCDSWSIEVAITLSFQDFETITEMYSYSVKNIENEAKITWFEKIFNEDENLTTESNKVNFFLKGEYCWEFKTDYRKNLKEPDRPEVYARLISRSIRFRESNPLIECAALIANMMSIRTARIAQQVPPCDKQIFLEQLYYLSRNKVFIQLSRDDRDNSWTSKFTAPSFGIDELVHLHQDKGIILGNCSQIISMYYGILRTRFAPEELFQIRFHNQDMLFIKLENDLYVWSDSLVKVSKRTLFYNNHITKIFNEKFIFSNGKLYNISNEKFRLILNYFKEMVPQLEWPELSEQDQNVAGQEITLDIPDAADQSGEQYQKQLFLKVLSLSQEHPDSIYTLAKYAYQTIYVDKFDAYLKWSEQSLIVVDFVKQFAFLAQFNEQIKTFGEQSIFLEPYRIMTADQVIRHKTGDSKSRALLYFVWFKVKYGYSPGIYITSQNAYCILQKGITKQYFDVMSQSYLNSQNEIKGVPILVYN